MSLHTSESSSSEKRVVLKVGTDVITPDGQPDLVMMKHLVDQIVQIRQEYGQVVLVSSGAMGWGRARKGVEKRDDETIVQKQRFTAAGQHHMVAAYDKLMETHGCAAHQIVLTRRGMTDAHAGGHMTVKRLLLDIMQSREDFAVLNENDGVDTTELRFSDNDQLAGYVARMLRADLIIGSKLNGLREKVNDPGSVIPVIKLGDDWEQHVDTSHRTNGGTGGWLPKGNTCAHLASRGLSARVVEGRADCAFTRVLINGEQLGTLFEPTERNRHNIDALLDSRMEKINGNGRV